MKRLKIVASGKSKQEEAQKRGKLFEKLMGNVLQHYGYNINKHKTNINYAGMEIDIEGEARIAGIPLYAECKCYSSDITSDKLQTFFGKYMSFWLKNNKSEGLFIAIPGVNSHARGFYNENCKSNNQISIKIIEEPDVIDIIIDSGLIINETEIDKLIKDDLVPGDRLLIYSDKGLFWLQYLISKGSTLPTKVQIFDSKGNTITDNDSIEYFIKLLPEIKDFEFTKDDRNTLSTEEKELIVELRGSSAYFEYQFPANPQFFIGRHQLVSDINNFFNDVINQNTSLRSILFEANSGWGKSSLVLKIVSHLKELGHYAIAIDSRSASSAQFILHAIEHLINKFGNFNNLIDKELIITGFDGVINALIEIGNALKSQGKLLLVFFDQFENIFYLEEVLVKIVQLILKITDIQTNVILGFSWKTDLVGLTSEFPYKWRDKIVESSQVFHLKQFSEIETNILLDKLSDELHAKLRKDLRFLISEFSQGYPWLLKKLCAHVKKQREAGVPQADMVRGLLNVEQLFLDDLEGLTPEQEEALRQISKRAPINISEIGEEFSPTVLQTLVDRRLIVRVGTKYDIYWDIFRDYLNTGKLPIEEVYLLRSFVGSVFKAITILQNNNGKLRTHSFKEQANLSDGAFLNIARDLRLLKIVKMESDHIFLLLPIGTDESELLQNFRNYLNDHLLRNRYIFNVVQLIKDKGEINIYDLAHILQNEFPYISASEKTWTTYAKILAGWLDIADLAIWDKSSEKLVKFKTGIQVRDHSLVFAKKRTRLSVPSIQFAPICEVAKRLVKAAKSNEPVNWTGLSKSTIYKSLSMLEEMNLIKREAKTLTILPDCYDFIDRRNTLKIGRNIVTKWKIFKLFIEILNENLNNRLTHAQLGKLLIEKYSLEWRPSTAETNVKIMLDWARHLNLAPGVYSHTYRGKFKAKDSK